ncbi:hypothetical protein D3C73_1382130 [compost metagenome]
MTADHLWNAQWLQILVFVDAQGMRLASRAIEFDLNPFRCRQRRASSNLHDLIVDSRVAGADEAFRHAQVHWLADIGGTEHPGRHIAVVPVQLDQVAFFHAGIR